MSGNSTLAVSAADGHRWQVIRCALARLIATLLRLPAFGERRGLADEVDGDRIS